MVVRRKSMSSTSKSAVMTVSLPAAAAKHCGIVADTRDDVIET